MARLLVVEDDETIGAALESSLHRHGHDVRWARTGREALTVAERSAQDLVLLDLGLPDLDGTEVCRQLRAAQPSAVVVILTARSEEMDVILGLEAGADDYLSKPVRLAELHARIRAHLRRESVARDDQQPIEIGVLRVDPGSRRASLAGREISLRSKEFELLLRLAREAGAAVSRDALMTDVWDAHWYGSTKTLDVHVAALRRKLGDTDADGASGDGASGDGDVEPGMPRIVTLRGHGYRLDVPDA